MSEATVWVIGLGTPHGEDRLGWDVAALLEAAGPDGVRVLATSDPLTVTDVSGGCRTLIVIDACRGSGAPGTVTRFEWPDPRLLETVGVSTHGIGLCDALRLLDTLGRRPAVVVIFSVEMAEDQSRPVISDIIVRNAAERVASECRAALRRVE